MLYLKPVAVLTPSMDQVRAHVFRGAQDLPGWLDGFLQQDPSNPKVRLFIPIGLGLVDGSWVEAVMKG